jgi:hypothetical protein
MKLLRVSYLLGVQCRGLVGRCWWSLVALFIVGLLVFLTAVGWDGEFPTLFGERELNVGASSDRRIGIPLQLASYLSLAWAASLILYAVPVVLLPLASSYSLSHTSWLRGLPCSPREVAASRAARLFSAVALTSLLALLWVAAMVAWHQVPPRLLLTVVLGWSGHLLLSGGFLLAIGPYLAGGTQRAAVVVLAVLLPVVLWLPTFLAANRLSGQPWESWLPYACPLTENFSHAARHYVAAGAAGLVLTMWSILCSGGRIIREVAGIPHKVGA